MKSISLTVFILSMFAIITSGCKRENEVATIKESRIESADYKKPVIIFIETNPWSMVMGSDAPLFALYESGLVIYRVIEDSQSKYYSIKLNTVGLNGLISSIILSDDIYSMEERIEASSWTDQPHNILRLDLNNHKVISVYGNLSKIEARDNAPKLFVEIYDKIKSYRNDSAVEWEPPLIEVMLWDYSYAPNKRSWPKKFPDINSPLAFKRGDSYSILIERELQKEFLDFFRSRGEKEAVEINGYKMAMSYRIPFPNIDFKME